MNNRQRSLFWIVVAAAIGMYAIPFIPYAMHFRGPLSNDQNVWGSFGAYIGGVVAPLLSFMSFVGVLYTVVIQREQLTLAKRESAQRIERDKLEEQLGNISHVLKTVAAQLEEKQDYYKKYVSNLSHNSQASYPGMQSVVFFLQQMGQYIAELEGIQKDSHLARYYRDRFTGMVTELGGKGMIDEKTRKCFLEVSHGGPTSR